MSKALFIFSYNDEHKVNSILRDRMYKISTKGYTIEDKRNIVKNYLIPVITKEIKFTESDLVFPDETIDYIVNNYTEEEAGVRNLKRCLETIFTKINLYRLLKPDSKLFSNKLSFKVEFPFTVDNKVVDELIVKNKEENENWKIMYM